MRDAAADICTILAAAGLGLAEGTSLFVGPMPEHGLAADGLSAPAKCASVMPTGGGSPEAFVGKGRKALLYPTCQVRIRSDREDFAGGQALAFAALEALNQISWPPYVSIRVRESAPFYGRTDAAGRHHWGFNVELQYLNDPA